MATASSYCRVVASMLHNPQSGDRANLNGNFSALSLIGAHSVVASEIATLMMSRRVTGWPRDIQRSGVIMRLSKADRRLSYRTSPV